MPTQGKIKIHKKMLFTDGDLVNYLKTVKRFSKIEEEILATLIYKKAYEKIYEKSALVAFPYKANKETEISKRSILIAEEIGNFIRKYAEENSPIDSILIDPRDNKKAIIRCLQIKFLGKGRYKNVTNRRFIELLKKYENYQKNKISLVIVLDSPHKIQLRVVVDWLKNNPFPFQEVILIRPNNKSGNMEFFQLKPSKNTFSSLKMTRKEIIGELEID